MALDPLSIPPLSPPDIVIPCQSDPDASPETRFFLFQNHAYFIGSKIKDESCNGSIIFEKLKDTTIFALKSDPLEFCEREPIMAHKLVLAFCSRFFRDVLLSQPSEEKVIIVPCATHHHMKILLKMMYEGSLDLNEVRDVKGLILSAMELGIDLEPYHNVSSNSLLSVVQDQIKQPLPLKSSSSLSKSPLLRLKDIASITDPKGFLVIPRSSEPLDLNAEDIAEVAKSPPTELNQCLKVDTENVIIIEPSAPRSDYDVDDIVQESTLVSSNPDQSSTTMTEPEEAGQLVNDNSVITINDEPESAASENHDVPVKEPIASHSRDTPQPQEPPSSTSKSAAKTPNCQSSTSSSEVKRRDDLKRKQSHSHHSKSPDPHTKHRKADKKNERPHSSKSRAPDLAQESPTVNYLGSESSAPSVRHNQRPPTAMKYHSESANQAGATIKCDLCHLKFQYLSTRAWHSLECHKSGYKCEACDELFPSKEDRQQHVVTVHPIQCSICSLHLASQQHLQRHEEKVHPALAKAAAARDAAAKEDLKCHICDKVFVISKTKKIHMKVAHKIVDDEPAKPPPELDTDHDSSQESGQGNVNMRRRFCRSCGVLWLEDPGKPWHNCVPHLTCRICDKHFASRADIRSHLTICHLSAFCCRICGQVFTSRADQGLHNNYHKRCQKCGKKVETEYGEYLHYLRVHERGKRYYR